jgi:TRAP-type C4-dicarboxylate transport system permease small subunit
MAQRLAEGLMVLALAGMVVAVFVNVVLRYVFHTSIVSYEEISRLLFVWLVAIGAIVAAFEGAHLGFDMVTSRVGPITRKVLFWVSQLLIGACMACCCGAPGSRSLPAGAATAPCWAIPWLWAQRRRWCWP